MERNLLIRKEGMSDINILSELSKEDLFIYTSINTNCDKHIPWHAISESLRAVWRKIYREKNGIKSGQSL